MAERASPRGHEHGHRRCAWDFPPPFVVAPLRSHTSSAGKSWRAWCKDGAPTKRGFLNQCGLSSFDFGGGCGLFDVNTRSLAGWHDRLVTEGAGACPELGSADRPGHDIRRGARHRRLLDHLKKACALLASAERWR